MNQNREKKKVIENGIKELKNSKINKKLKPHQKLYNKYSFLIIYIYKTISILLLFTYKSLNIQISKLIKKTSFINLIIFFTFINLSKEANILQLNYLYEIKITVKGNGTQMILSNYTAEYNNRILNFTHIPNEILINNELQDYTGKYVYNLRNEYNNITMRWNNPLNDTNCMFYKIKNITFFDFSNFDTKDVKEMTYMFRENDISKLDLSTFNTSSVTNMAGMFEYCWYLISLDISNFDTSLVTDFVHTFKNFHFLTSLNIDNLNTKSALNMVGMFEGNDALTSLNLKNFNTGLVLSMWCIFVNLIN